MFFKESREAQTHAVDLKKEKKALNEQVFYSSKASVYLSVMVQ